MEDSELSDIRAVIVVVAGPIDPAPAEAAVAAAGFNVWRVSFDGAARAIGEQPAVAVLIEAIGLSAEGAAGLPAIVAAAEAARLRTVVVFDTARIDAIAGDLLGRDVILLCEPDPVERTGAIALAALDQQLTLRDSSGEAARLQRLNEEVARFAETLARLSRRDDGAGVPAGGEPFVADRHTGFGGEPAAAEAGEIRRTIRARRLRDDVFASPGLFEDPAWDMLLDLFAAELERRRVSVSSLCIAAAVAPTTALRWIGKLIEAGLLDRRPDEFDRRRAFIALTGRASLAMRNYVAAVRRAGLSVA